MRVLAHAVLGLMACGFLIQVTLLTTDPTKMPAPAAHKPPASPLTATIEAPPRESAVTTPRATLALGLPPRIGMPPLLVEPAPAIVDPGRLRLDRLREKIVFKPDVRDDCTPPALMAVIYDLAEKFGEVRIASTHRDSKRNARVGGARRSLHLECRAVDFMIGGRPKEVLEFLKNHASVGGYKRYPLGHYHIDNGPRRTW